METGIYDGMNNIFNIIKGKVEVNKKKLNNVITCKLNNCTILKKAMRKCPLSNN